MDKASCCRTDATLCVCSGIWDEVLGEEECAGETGARCALCPQTPRSSLRIPSTGIGSASRAHGRGGAHDYCLRCSAPQLSFSRAALSRTSTQSRAETAQQASAKGG
jgi:hypothetical protein